MYVENKETEKSSFTFLAAICLLMCQEQTPCCSDNEPVCEFVFRCVADGHLTDSPAGCVVDTIKEPSNVAEGDLTSSPPTYTAQLSASVYSVVWKVSQIMLTNIPDWASCGFSLLSTRSCTRLLWPQRFNIISEDARSMWKIFVAIKKGQLVLIVWHAVKATESVCVGVCERRAYLIWVTQTHLFPSRMDLIEATGQGADRFIRVISSWCPVSQSAVQQLPGLQWQPWWAPGGQIASDTGPSCRLFSTEIHHSSNSISVFSKLLLLQIGQY